MKIALLLRLIAATKHPDAHLDDERIAALARAKYAARAEIERIERDLREAVGVNEWGDGIPRS